jgi:hypothetical protein
MPHRVNGNAACQIAVVPSVRVWQQNVFDEAAFPEAVVSFSAHSHCAFVLFKKPAQMIWDFVSFGQLHLLHIDSLADFL